MVDYIEAFRQGLDAAEAADRARKEIDTIFADLNRQLKKATGNKIGIDRREYEYKAPQSIWDTLSLKLPPKPKEKYWAIAAFNPSVSESPVKQLARWSIDRAGYPCKIAWGG